MQTNKNVIVSGYKITASNEVINKLYGVTPDIEDKLYEMSVKVKKGKNSAIKELNDLIKKYPHIPQFKNFLCSLYDNQGNHFKAKEVNNRLTTEHPNYLFGRLNSANIAIEEKVFEKVLNLMGESLELKALYPERDEFHYGEVVGFLQTTFNYFIRIEDTEQAQIRLEIIKKLNKEFEIGLEIFNFERKITGVNLQKGLKRQQEELATRRTPNVIVKKIVEPTTQPPQFTHSIIHQLYCNDLLIDQQIISEILALPHETLVADLHKVVYDSVARKDVFAEMDWDPETHEFLMHALLLLIEIKDESSVDVLMDVLRQDQDYLETWFSDFLTDGFWELLYVIANDKLDQLYRYVVEPNGYTYSKSCVSQMAQQIVFHQPERRVEVAGWYRCVFEFWIANKENDDVIDTELIAFYVSDIVNVNLVELIPEMQTLFNFNLVATGVSGSLEDCMEDINGLITVDREHTIFSTIEERYTNYTSTWLAYQDEEESGYDYDDDEEMRKEMYEEMKTIIPVPGSKPNIGRNDPCVCGSGKKYKKCCGN